MTEKASTRATLAAGPYVHMHETLHNKRACLQHRSFDLMLGSFYKRAFERHPWATLAVTNGSLTVLADSLAQLYEHRSLAEATQKWDNHRTGRFLVFGTAMAPLLAEWNKYLEFRFPIHSVGGTMLWSGLFRRLFMDQVLFAPFGLALFVGSMGIMEGRRTQNELAEKFNDVCGYYSHLSCICQLFWQTGRFGLSCKPSILASCLYGRYRFDSHRFRVPFSASCGVAWTLYLSVLNQSKALVEA